MSRLIECGEHGVSRPAFVCTHLVTTLREGTPLGVIWSRDENECVNAYCSACEERLIAGGGKWTRELEATADIQLICDRCFERVLSINEATEAN